MNIKNKPNKKLFGNDYVEQDYIFTWKDGKLFRPDHVTKGFQKVLKKSGFSHMRFHDLRHNCASIFHSKGYSLKNTEHSCRLQAMSLPLQLKYCPTTLQRSYQPYDTTQFLPTRYSISYGRQPYHTWSGRVNDVIFKKITYKLFFISLLRLKLVIF